MWTVYTPDRSDYSDGVEYTYIAGNRAVGSKFPTREEADVFAAEVMASGDLVLGIRVPDGYGTNH